MPYTPPSRQSSVSSTSAASSKHNIARYHDGPPPSPGSQRPLPRSSSSSSLARAQRSEEAQTLHAAAASSKSNDVALGGPEYRLDQGASPQKAGRRHRLYQHAPESVSSEESMASSDSRQGSGDESESKKADRKDQLEALGNAVRLSLNITRRGSPEPPTDNLSEQEAEGERRSRSPEVGRLSAAARKISHSRSSTESAIMFSSASAPDLTALGSGCSDEDEGLDSDSRPSLPRKKSGELIKPAIRPANRRKVSSMPGTPTFSKKGVHFNDDLQQVRHFLQVDRPIAVSAGGSPVEAFEDEAEFPFGPRPPVPKGLEIRLANFPRESHERQSLPVRLERITLLPDQKTLMGSVAVANLAFHKVVAARFTFDNWRTVSEVTAEFCGEKRVATSRADGYDVFDFNVKLSDQANLEKKTMFICVRYNVGGQEYWDNNSSGNFRVEFVKREAPKSETPHKQLSQPKAIPRSRHNSPSSQRLQPSPSIDDDFAAGFGSIPAINMGSGFPRRRVMPDTPPPRRQNKAGQAFGNRYDFGTSLSAALSNAQSQLGEKSGIRAKNDSAPPASFSGRESDHSKPASTRLTRQYPGSSGSESPRPESLLANKQSVDSRAYQELVSKFCFVSLESATLLLRSRD